MSTHKYDMSTLYIKQLTYVKSVDIHMFDRVYMCVCPVCVNIPHHPQVLGPSPRSYALHASFCTRKQTQEMKESLGRHDKNNTIHEYSFMCVCVCVCVCVTQACVTRAANLMRRGRLPLRVHTTKTHTTHTHNTHTQHKTHTIHTHTHTHTLSLSLSHTHYVYTQYTMSHTETKRKRGSVCVCVRTARCRSGSPSWCRSRKVTSPGPRVPRRTGKTQQ